MDGLPGEGSEKEASTMTEPVFSVFGGAGGIGGMGRINLDGLILSETDGG